MLTLFGSLSLLPQPLSGQTNTERRGEPPRRPAAERRYLGDLFGFGIDTPGDASSQRPPLWRIVVVPALAECSPAQAALEVALAELRKECPELGLAVVVPSSLPLSHPLRTKLAAANLIEVPDDEFVRLESAWPLPRVAVLGADMKVLFESSIPLGWADESLLLDALASFRRWAVENR